MDEIVVASAEGSNETTCMLNAMATAAAEPAPADQHSHLEKEDKTAIGVPLSFSELAPSVSDLLLIEHLEATILARLCGR